MDTVDGVERRLLGVKHSSVRRDYLGRVTDDVFPKYVAADLAKKWGFDYWDGDRRINYGGYHYVSGFWTPLAIALVQTYGLTSSSRVLDVGCGKGFLLRELGVLLPGIELAGLDISSYALENSHPDVTSFLVEGSATALPWKDLHFDLVISINTLHNLPNYDLEVALRELQRVGARKYIVVESYRSELEKMNLLYWQVTCEAFCSPLEWKWWLELTGYDGDFEFIYFE